MGHVFWCTGHALIFPEIIRGEGCFLYDRQGRKYIDLEIAFEKGLSSRGAPG